MNLEAKEVSMVQLVLIKEKSSSIFIILQMIHSLIQYLLNNCLTYFFSLRAIVELIDRLKDE